MKNPVIGVFGPVDADAEAVAGGPDGALGPDVAAVEDVATGELLTELSVTRDSSGISSMFELLM